MTQRRNITLQLNERHVKLLRAVGGELCKDTMRYEHLELLSMLATKEEIS